MATINDILRFADTQKVFTRKDLIKYLTDAGKLNSQSSLSEQLNRLIKGELIIRVKRGVYKFADKGKTTFSVYCTEDIKNIAGQIRQKLPFIEFCIWDSSALLPYVHHIPNIKFIYVDVERDAAESVFNLLNSGTTRRVFLMPTKQYFDRYITGTDAVIIRQLISEAPLQKADEISTPSIEKVLVDITGDTEFDFLQGSELHYVYNSIFRKHKVNKKKLLRYAARRARKKEIQQLLNINKL